MPVSLSTLCCQSKIRYSLNHSPEVEMLDKIDAFLQDPRAQKLLFFNEMLTPSLVRLAYWLCLLAVVWTGLTHMFSDGFWHFIEGIVHIVTGALLARIAAELIIVLFKLNEKMGMIVANTDPAASSQADTAPKAAKKVTKRAGKKVSKKP